jgi:hypothetical protein
VLTHCNAGARRPVRHRARHWPPGSGQADLCSPTKPARARAPNSRWAERIGDRHCEHGGRWRKGGSEGQSSVDRIAATAT